MAAPPRPSRRVRVRVLAAAWATAALAGCGTAQSTGSSPPPASRAADCPLTDLPAPAGRVPGRPTLAVKVDNVGAARPQYGLQAADVVIEEPVEGGLTRFIALYQCRDAARIEPVRSGRIIDPEIVEQFGSHPLLAYAGGIDAAVAAIDASPLIDVGTARAPAGTYRRDAGRPIPHNLYSSTAALYAVGRAEGAPERAPAPVFTYGPPRAGAAAVTSVGIGYPASPVTWVWQRAAGTWERVYPSGPAAAAEGGTLTATNVVIQSVVMYPSVYVEDPTGAHENLLTLTGSGPAEVLRNGSVVVGTWSRATLGDRTRLLDRAGRALPLAAGRTWVELVPRGVVVTRAPAAVGG